MRLNQRKPAIGSDFEVTTILVRVLYREYLYFKEETKIRKVLSIGDLLPEGKHDLTDTVPGLHFGMSQKILKMRPNFCHDGNDQFVLRTEMVDEHTGTGVDGGGQWAEREIGDAMIEKVAKTFSGQLLICHVTTVTYNHSSCNPA